MPVLISYKYEDETIFFIKLFLDICDKHGIWLHIDAAWGGGLLMSRKYKEKRFKGIERWVVSSDRIIQLFRDISMIIISSFCLKS